MLATAQGADSTWDRLDLHANAELEDVSIGMTKILRQVPDPLTRQFIGKIEKLSKQKTIESPVRAIREPMTIQIVISNPLAMEVELQNLQLVAKMQNDDSFCTNEDAVKITPLVTSDDVATFEFPSSDDVFWLPDFCRMKTKSKWKSAEEVTPCFVVTKTNVKLTGNETVSYTHLTLPTILLV